MKGLTTTLCVFQLSTQEVIYQSFKHVSLLKEISTRWKIVEVGVEHRIDGRRARIKARI